MNDYGREMLTNYASKVNDGVIVELGAWQGNSACAMAKGILEAGHEIKIYSLDLWGSEKTPDYYKNNPEIYDTSNYDLFLQNTKPYADMITPIKGYFSNIEKDWTLPIGMLFIDGCHDFMNVMEDYILWSKHVIKGGIILFHDHDYSHPDVMRVVAEVKRTEQWTEWKIEHHMAGAIKL